MPTRSPPFSAEAFVQAWTRLVAPPDVPEIRLHLADALAPLWEATADVLAARDVDPPYWAFAWPGGIALARHVLDHPDLVAGRRVLDVGAGSGIVALAAALAGAAEVTANDVDPTAAAAIRCNAIANGLEVRVDAADLLDGPAGADVVLAGDVCYEQPMASRMDAFLRRAARDGATVLLADPGRHHRPPDLDVVAWREVTVSRAVENEDRKRVAIGRLGRPKSG